MEFETPEAREARLMAEAAERWANPPVVVVNQDTTNPVSERRSQWRQQWDNLRRVHRNTNVASDYASFIRAMMEPVVAAVATPQPPEPPRRNIVNLRDAAEVAAHATDIIERISLAPHGVLSAAGTRAYILDKIAETAQATEEYRSRRDTVFFVGVIQLVIRHSFRGDLPNLLQVGEYDLRWVEPVQMRYEGFNHGNVVFQTPPGFDMAPGALNYVDRDAAMILQERNAAQRVTNPWGEPEIRVTRSRMGQTTPVDEPSLDEPGPQLGEDTLADAYIRPAIDDIFNLIQTDQQKQLWENHMHIEYAKDICTRAGIQWKDSYSQEVEKLTDKLSVNRFIFEDLVNRPKEINGIPSDLVNILSSRSPASQIARRVDAHNATINTHLRNIDQNQRNIKDYLHRIQRERAEIERIFGLSEEDTFVDELKRILAGGLYEYLRPGAMGGGIFWLKSTNDVVIHHKDAAKGMDMRINFGKLHVRVDLNGTLGVEFPDIPDSKRTDGYAHPHVSGTTVCWGNAQPTYNKFAQEGKLGDALNALWLIVTNYNDQSPYTGIEKFYLVHNTDAFAGAPRKPVRNGEAWIPDSVLEEQFGDPVGWPFEILDSEERENKDGDVVTNSRVQIWEMRIMPHNIPDPAGGYYVAGPRGGNPIRLTCDDDVLDFV